MLVLVLGIAQMTGLAYSCFFLRDGITMALNDCEETDTAETVKFSQFDHCYDKKDISPLLCDHCNTGYTLQTKDNLPQMHTIAPETPPPNC